MDKSFVAALKEIVIKAGELSVIARKKGLIIEGKEDNSPVTNADKEISDYIYTKLKELQPEIPVICEERVVVNLDQDKFFWLVDPIDGTRSYIKNKDTYTVNVALIRDGKAIMGFIYQPPLKKLYFTDENINFCLETNGQKVERTISNQLFTAIVSSNHLSNQTQRYIQANVFSEIIAIPSSIKLCMIAEGTGDVYPKFSDTMEWDIAAGHAIIKAAGGNVLDTNGQEMLYAKPNFLNSHFLACGQRWLFSNKMS